jgi:hypothetical protein
MNVKSRLVAVGLTGLVLVMGCASPQAQQHAGALGYGATGAALGGIAGAMAGNNIRGLNTGEGAVAGAALGAIIGAAMGAQQDTFNAKIGAVSEQATTTIINVKNSNGSYTPVLIRKVGTQYVGPRGEYYNALPTEDQLKTPYGF